MSGWLPCRYLLLALNNEPLLAVCMSMPSRYTQQGELTAFSPTDAKLLCAALIRASAGVRSMAKLSGSGLTLTLSAIPLQFTQGQPCQHIALFFERTAVCDSGMVVFFARSQGLSRTEEHVLTPHECSPWYWAQAQIQAIYVARSNTL